MLGFLQGWVEQLLMTVVVLRDTVEQSKFTVSMAQMKWVCRSLQIWVPGSICTDAASHSCLFGKGVPNSQVAYGGGVVV